MDTSTIITQVNRDDEQLNYTGDRGTIQNEKKSCKSLFKTLFCCCFSKAEAPSVGSNGTCITEETPPPRDFQTSPSHYLLPPLGQLDVQKKCMVIDLDETLVHSSFKPISNADFIVPVEIDGTVHQVYVLKRPFVDDFLQRMGELYECILFTASLAKYADPVANLLDKWSVFRARLFREACVFHRGNYVKDLGRLGRDLHKVVIMDNSPASYSFHPDNAVPVSSWFDDMSDSELIDLIPFLETLSKVDNVYSVLRNCNNPLNTAPIPAVGTSGPVNNREKGSIANLAPLNGQTQLVSQLGPLSPLQPTHGGGGVLNQMNHFSSSEHQQQNGSQTLLSTGVMSNSEEVNPSEDPSS